MPWQRLLWVQNFATRFFQGYLSFSCAQQSISTRKVICRHLSKGVFFGTWSWACCMHVYSTKWMTFALACWGSFISHESARLICWEMGVVKFDLNCTHLSSFHSGTTADRTGDLNFRTNIPSMILDQRWKKEREKERSIIFDLKKGKEFHFFLYVLRSNRILISFLQFHVSSMTKKIRDLHEKRHPSFKVTTGFQFEDNVSLIFSRRASKVVSHHLLFLVVSLSILLLLFDACLFYIICVVIFFMYCLSGCMSLYHFAFVWCFFSCYSLLNILLISLLGLTLLWLKID